MKDAQLKAWVDYSNAKSKATDKDRLKSEIDNSSVAEDQLDAYVKLDCSMHYNSGTLYTDLTPVAEKKYRQWVKDWGLPEPTGKPPKKSFYLGDYL